MQFPNEMMRNGMKSPEMQALTARLHRAAGWCIIHVFLSGTVETLAPRGGAGRPTAAWRRSRKGRLLFDSPKAY